MYNFDFKKTLGQNFLKDDNIVNKIVNATEYKKNNLVIEIGPGAGSLTKKLLPKVDKAILYEIDTRLERILNKELAEYDNYTIIFDDFLNRNVNDDLSNYCFDNLYIVANLPYYITTPIIMKLIEDRLDIESITVMIQKEVADRLIEIPGGKNTGAITYTVYYYCTSKKIMEVPNTSFIPEPEVTSEIIKMDLRYKPVVDVENPQIMFRIIKSAFMQRRKTLLNALTNANVFINKEQGINTLKELNLKENVRAEELTIQDFSNITKIVFGKLKGKKGTDPKLPF